jgi:hypothetical protein
MRGRNVPRVTREAVAALGVVARAQKLAVDLRDAKSDHPWTNRECQLLDELLKVLGVET